MILLIVFSGHTVLKTKNDLRSSEKSETSLKLQKVNQEWKAMVAVFKPFQPAANTTPLTALTGVSLPHMWFLLISGVCAKVMLCR